MRKHVSISPVCMKMGLLPSVLEIYNKETNGFIIGGNGSNKMNVISSYTMQTDNKKPTYVEHGNISALQRVYGLMDSMNWHVIGGFHSHPGGPNKLSLNDKDHIQDKMKENNLKEWLEILFSVQKKDYSREQKFGWYYKKRGKKISIKIVTDNYTGFNVTVSGFWLKQNKKLPKIVMEADVRTPKLTIA